MKHDKEYWINFIKKIENMRPLFTDSYDSFKSRVAEEIFSLMLQFARELITLPEGYKESHECHELRKVMEMHIQAVEEE